MSHFSLLSFFEWRHACRFLFVLWHHISRCLFMIDVTPLFFLSWVTSLFPVSFHSDVTVLLFFSRVTSRISFSSREWRHASRFLSLTLSSASIFSYPAVVLVFFQTFFRFLSSFSFSELNYALFFSTSVPFTLFSSLKLKDSERILDRDCACWQGIMNSEKVTKIWVVNDSEHDSEVL